MTTATHNYGWLMPDPGRSANTWGNALNGATQAIDSQLYAVANPSTITITKTPPSTPGMLQFNNAAAPAGQQFRWAIGMYANAEPGGNVGSDLEFNYYTDLAEGFLIRR